jgi:hypothetical protein
MEIEHEELGIEDLFLTDKDDKIKIIITIEDRGDFKAYVTPVSYGEIKKIERASEVEIADYVLTNHFFKGNEERFTSKELELLPAGVLRSVAEKIMELSGLNISNEDIKTF